MTNKIGHITHPKHFDVNRMSRDGGYASALNRFNEILDNKIYAYNKPNISIPVISGSRFDIMKSPGAEDIVKDVTRKTGRAAEKIDAYFKGTALEGLGKDFENAERKSGVNGVFLAALAALESNSGRSAIAREKNNLFGFQAFDSDPYSNAASFENYAAGIDFVSSYLKREYLSEDGSYYNGTSIEDINKKYATDKNWHKKLADIIGDILR